MAKDAIGLGKVADRGATVIEICRGWCLRGFGRRLTGRNIADGRCWRGGWERPVASALGPVDSLFVGSRSLFPATPTWGLTVP